jgi:hypothetical protein
MHEELYNFFIIAFKTHKLIKPQDRTDGTTIRHWDGGCCGRKEKTSSNRVTFLILFIVLYHQRFFIEFLIRRINKIIEAW